VTTLGPVRLTDGTGYAPADSFSFWRSFVRGILIYSLTTDQFVVIGPILRWGVLGAFGLGTYLFMRQRRSRQQPQAFPLAGLRVLKPPAMDYVFFSVIEMAGTILIFWVALMWRKSPASAK
jgi:hypothetical protein